MIDLDTLGLRDPPTEIPPGTTVSIPYDLVGDLPLGKTTGTAAFDADQLSKPVIVNFEIETRFTPHLILVVILVGLIAGFLMRTVLARQIELSEARLKAFDLVAKINDSLQHYPDGKFKQQVTEELDNLREALEAASLLRTLFVNASQIEALVKAVTQADTALHAALTKLETRRLAAQNRLVQMTSVTTATELPASIAAVIRAADQHTNAARKRLGDGRPDEADDELSAALHYLQTELGEPVHRWRVTVDLDRRRPEDMPLPAYVSGGLKKRSQCVRHPAERRALRSTKPRRWPRSRRPSPRCAWHAPISRTCTYNLSRWFQVAARETHHRALEGVGGTPCRTHGCF